MTDQGETPEGEEQVEEEAVTDEDQAEEAEGVVGRGAMQDAFATRTQTSREKPMR